MLYQDEDDNSISINANSSANAGNSDTDENGVFMGDSSLQTPEEFEKDKKQDHSKEDNRVTASGVDDLQSNSDGAAGTDKAGTAERKPYGDTELNKGLEAQARDEEGA
ncbi:hypothetical protein [Segetibacter aerophilus]|uniref:Uncharacterized protein n=1 Tax=Segetibacter aerophilus TaxID=670293 RepID=A0A512BD00_9BACT|nr:hypothetical protein [Segetibacter aerophilus]GEO09737.1 hypothetical protein SAE01_22330 [Segetibacter aerophilus]